MNDSPAPSSGRHAVRWSALVAVLVLGAALAACSSSDGDDPGSAPVSESLAPGPITSGSDASGTLATGSTATGSVATGSSAPGSVAPGSVAPEGGALPEGFTRVTARITETDGEVCEVCLWLADTADERGRGLMGVDDLGDAVGMVFVFDEPFLGAFYMFQTPTPLSIAWFATDGAWVGSAEMAPCLDTPADECPRYQPDQQYDLAIEVFADPTDQGSGTGGDGGALEALGLGPGAVVELLAGTAELDCQTPSS
jgi:uncharacterized membrane protein (UPF0127 family)